ncbi:hypothetical protein T492DRAFT_1005559 [Pavlovales sp. CCMP2436]|nr:hypothetical protein T492DRAFT_1005559 [Pavlovales sp. CCMP2436]|mmetsp:Transcript_33172/g.82453  ORF Transcript_33172/g.82453 Transcript_33172/m.82453 type:complete len:170 (+) Transcript_33172:99-608(+)
MKHATIFTLRRGAAGYDAVVPDAITKKSPAERVVGLSVSDLLLELAPPTMSGSVSSTSSSVQTVGARTPTVVFKPPDDFKSVTGHRTLPRSLSPWPTAPVPAPAQPAIASLPRTIQRPRCGLELHAASRPMDFAHRIQRPRCEPCASGWIGAEHAPPGDDFAVALVTAR